MFRRKISWLFLLTLLFPFPVFSQQVLAITRDAKSYDVTPYMSFYEDTENSLTIENVIQLDANDLLFRKRSDANFGVITYKVWGKFKFANESSEDWWLLYFKSERLSGDLNVYVVSENKIIKTYHQNDWISFQNRVVQHKNEIIPLGIPDKVQTVYFSLRPSASTMELSASLYTAVAFIEKDYRDMLVLGIYYGIMISMLIYNAFILFAARDKAYLYYIVYLLVYIFAQSSLDGLFIQYISPDHIEKWHLVVIIGASIAWPCYILFTTSVLPIKKHYPRVYIFYQFMLAMFFVPSILYPFVHFEKTTVLVAFLIIIVTITSSIISFLLSFKIQVAQYYFAATALFVLGMAIQEVKLFDIYIPVLGEGNYSVQFGSALEALLFSLAMGYRIKVMRESSIAKDDQIKQLEYSNLQGKVNPHFLYNSLNMILEMLQADKKAAAQTVVDLANIYEYMSYYVAKDLVPLKEEWQFAKKYFKIMNKRSGQKMLLKEDFSAKAHEFMVPPLSLQPLIENCLKHGRPKSSFVTSSDNTKSKSKVKYVFSIFLRAEIHEQALILSIVDNGQFTNTNIREGGSLESIKHRFEHYYTNVNVSIQPANDVGTKVEISISERKKRSAEN
ncbi:MAG: histidine kinase [Spirochaetia bacterium]|nr:histidine kinase [Spirochaetia bacterium]